jgi:hypothetical protein
MLLSNVLFLASLIAGVWSLSQIMKSILCDCHCHCGRRLDRLSFARKSKLTDLVFLVEYWLLACLISIFAIGGLTNEISLAGAVGSLLGGIPFLVFQTARMSEHFEAGMRLVTDPYLTQDQLSGMTIRDLTHLMTLAEAAGELENASLIARQLVLVRPVLDHQIN